jgi:hypothetical protein
MFQQQIAVGEQRPCDFRIRTDAAAYPKFSSIADHPSIGRRALASFATRLMHMIGRKPTMLATVALAHRMTRIAWALMTKERRYEARLL